MNSQLLSKENIQIENKIYSAQKLAEFHPGGRLFVRSFASTDATTAFLSYHRKKFPHHKVAFAYESTDDTVTNESIVAVESDFLELCERVHKVLPPHKTFASKKFYIKAYLLLFSSISLESYIHTTGTYNSSLLILQGFLFALIGLNIQHDANHGAVSRKWWINRFLGASMNYIGHSAVDWIHQHDVLHHIHTNDTQKDPDIEGTVLYRLNPKRKLYKFHAFQYIYYFMIINLYGILLSFYTLSNLFHGAHHTSFSVLVEKYWKIESVGSLFMIFRWFILPFIWRFQVSTLFVPFITLGVFGQYIAFFFILSHNFIGVKHLTGEENKKSFVFHQVSTTSNVGGRLLCFFNGGLNYQIEHHLFPRICSENYPKIAPIVKAFCQEKGFPYTHFPTIHNNFISTAEHLLGMGTEIFPTTCKYI